MITFSHDVTSGQQKPFPFTDLNHLVTWTEEFQHVLGKNKLGVSVIDLMKGYNDYPIGKSKYHVDQVLQILESAINFELGFDVTHSDTRGQNYAITNIMFEDSNLLTDLIGQVFAALYSKCLVRIVVKTNQFFSATLASLLVDLMYQSGATRKEIKCLALDRRDSLGCEMKFIKCLGSRKTSRLSIVAAVFKETDTFAAAQGIIESYFREQYPNLIILVEESNYERFVRDWQRYYSHALAIGDRLDSKSCVVDQFNAKVQIDLNCIDIKVAHKMSNYCINVLKFRNLADFSSLLGNLRKVPYMTIWNDDLLVSRKLCLRTNICHEFWLNHIPKQPAQRQLSNDMLSFYGATVAPDMADLYNSVAQEFADDMAAVKKLQASFVKKDPKLRTNIILQAYLSLLAKNNSLKNGQTPSELIARLRRFQMSTLHTMAPISEPGESRIEIIRKPVGFAVLIVREMENSAKSRQVLVELIFKNLLLGNGVLLVCPHNALGAKFALENDHVIPFKMVHDIVPDISRLSLGEVSGVNTSVDTSTNDMEINGQELQNQALDTSLLKKQCPGNTFAVEIMPDMTSDACDTITVSVGTKAKEIWFPDADISNYWSSET